MFRIDQAFSLALLSTASSAGVTILLLFYIHDKAWSAEFLRLYSVIGLSAGWINSLLYYWSPRKPILQRRAASIAALTAALAIVATLYWLLFDHVLSGWQIGFTLVSLTPVAWASAFGLEFFEGNYPWPYQRNVVFNAAIGLGVIVAFGAANSEAALYGFSTLLGAPVLGWALLGKRRWISTHSPASSWAQSLINPAVPLLERNVWDQLVASRLGSADFALWIYGLGRAVAFSGSLAQSYFSGTNNATSPKRAALAERASIWISAALALACGAAAFFSPVGGVLLGQVTAWTLAAFLAARYLKTSESYFTFVALGALELIARAAVFRFSQSLEFYGTLVAAISATVLIASFILSRRSTPATEESSIGVAAPKA